MSAFDLAELRRLSEAATKGPWAYESSNDCLYAPEDGEDAPPIGDIESVRNAHLIAYLGTHRDRIVALLEAGRKLRTAAGAYDESQRYYHDNGLYECHSAEHKELADAIEEYDTAAGKGDSE